jgi:hypothetical protein
MCGSILDRRRQATSDNVVPMPLRAEDRAAAEDRATARTASTPVPPVHEESTPERLADEHFSAPDAPLYPRDTGSFSIFGVDTGAPARNSDVPHGLHGPSFLGLGDADANGDTDYLFEDEESHGGRKFLLFVVLLVVGGLAFLQYRADTPVTSIWAAIKSRATGQPAQQKPAPQEPAANGVQPAQPTSDKADTSQQANNSEPPAGNAQSAAANSNPAPADQSKSPADDASANPPDKSAAKNGDENQPAAAGTKPPQTAQAEKPRKDNAELMAKAQHPQSDQDTSAQEPRDQQDQEEAPAKTHGKPSAAMEPRSDREDDALVARAQGYLYGKGGRQSCTTALSLLKQAAGRGNPKADSQLGAMYATGNCAPFDRAEAYRWFSKAAEADPGNSYLQRSRDMMWREMSPQERRKVLE